ncbi:hypothetical protein ACHWQZ_G003358 [Mnemiopsis leidyi]
MAVQYRAKKYLEEIFEETGIGTDNHFGEDNLREVNKACGSMFSNICRVYGCDDVQKLSSEVLNKNTVVKAQMAEWLHTAIVLLEQCCLPLMSSARKTVEQLQEDKISDQRTVIELQEKLIRKKDRELGVVSQTVEKELKSYSSVLQQSCTTALSPKNIVTAVQKITKEEDRTKEVLVFGVDEDASECVTSKVTTILEQLDEKPRIRGCRRIGQRVSNADTKRPIIFSVNSTDVVYQILRKAKRLREIEGFKTVFISPNRTPEERISRQKLVNELKQRRSSDPIGRYFIQKGEIVKADN